MRTRFTAALTTFVLVWALFAGLTANVAADRGGGDEYGYSWIDSNLPSPRIAFDWIDITGIGVDSMVTGDDSNSIAISLGFTFPFYGGSYTELYFSTNGLITLGSGSSDWFNDNIPSTNTPNLLIAPYWDDLCVDYGGYNTGTIYYQSLGSSPNRQFIVEWWQVSRLWSTTEMTFEAILNETGEIWFQYFDMNGVTGSSATVGVENSDGTIGSKYSYNDPVLSDSLAVMFSSSTVGVTPSSQIEGAYAGDSAFHEVTIINNRAITDSFDIVTQSDAGWNIELFDQWFNPLTDTNSNGIDDTGDVLGGAIVIIWIRVDVPVNPTVRHDNTTMTATSYVDPDDSTAVKVITKVLIAEFSPPHSDYGNDTDSDGQFNLLEIDVVVNATFDGYVYLDAYLYDSVWSYIDYIGLERHVDPGESTLRLAYTGWKINLGGHDGPFNVELYLYEYDDDWWSLGSDLYTTAAYTSDEFEEPPAHLEPPYHDHGVDSDGNGYYDALAVVVPVNVTEEGYFDLYVGLFDGMFITLFDDRYITIYLEVGVNDVEVTFDGRAIRDYGYDGRFGVELELFTGIGEFLDYDAYWSNLYLHTEFEPPGASLSLTHETHGLDTNDNGFYDYLVVEVYVHVTRAGFYTLFGSLCDSGMTEIDVDVNESYLDVGVQVVELWFSGKSIYYFGYDGSFYVEVALEEDMDIIDGLTYYTDPYTYLEFEPPGAVFEPPHSDTVVDTNGNGYFDYLIINASVNVSTSGYYEVYVELYDWWPSYISDFSNWTYLDEGVQQVQIWVDGLELHQGGWDGPYAADMSLWDDDSYFISADMHWTASHLWDEFEPPGASFSPPHDDNGLDTDDDGLFDYLSVNVSIDVVTSGDYLIDARLWPFSVWETVEIYLDVGTQVVEILFDGRLVNVSGHEGSMEVDLWIYDSDWNDLDFDMHTTGVYSCDDFRGAPIMFSAPPWDFGLNTTGGGDFEYLVVNVTVEVGEAGVYTVAAEATSWIVVYARAEASLGVGTHSVSVMFPAWPLFASGFSGIYMVELYLIAEDGTEWSYDFYETGSYEYTDFNGTPPTISSTWTDVAPSIDGVMEPGEWDGSSAVDLVEEDPANELDSMLIAMNNATHLFICYDSVGDTSEDEDDASSFSFDTDNDGIATNGAEDQFMMYCAPDSTAHYSYDLGWWSVHCSPFDNELPDHEGLAGAYGFGPSDYELADHRIFEYAIPLALIDASPGDVLGFCGASWSIPGVVEWFDWGYSTWPNFYGGFPGLNQFGDLALAPERPTTTATVEGTMGDGWYVSEVTVTLHSSGGDGGVNYTMYRVNGGDWATYIEPFEVSVPGAVLVEFYSVDVMGNEEEVKSTSFTIEDLEPNTLMSLIGGKGLGDYYVTPSVVVLLTASDDPGGSGVGSTMYRLDGGSWTEYPTGGVEVDGDGNHTIEFYSVDNVGNEEAVHSETILIDCTAPSTTASVSGSNVTLTASDDGSGVASTMYRVDGGDWVDYDGAFPVTAAGNHSVDYYSVDAAGNIEVMGSVTVENAPSDEPEDEEGGISALVSGMLGLIIGAIVVAAIMMVLMRKKQPGTPSVSDEAPHEPEAEDDLPPPPS